MFELFKVFYKYTINDNLSNIQIVTYKLEVLSILFYRKSKHVYFTI